MKSLAILATLIAGAVYGAWWLAPIVIAAALLLAIREYGPDDPEPTAPQLGDPCVRCGGRSIQTTDADWEYTEHETRLLSWQCFECGHRTTTHPEPPPMTDLRRRQVDGVVNGEYRRAEGRRR